MDNLSRDAAWRSLVQQDVTVLAGLLRSAQRQPLGSCLCFGLPVLYTCHRDMHRPAQQMVCQGTLHLAKGQSSCPALPLTLQLTYLLPEVHSAGMHNITPAHCLLVSDACPTLPVCRRLGSVRCTLQP